MAKYALKDSSLQDIQTKTTTLISSPGELGTIVDDILIVDKNKLAADEVETLFVVSNQEVLFVAVNFDEENQILIGSESQPITDEATLLLLLKLK